LAFPNVFLAIFSPGYSDYLRDYLSCGCCDRYDSVYDDNYPGYDDDYEGDYNYEGDYDYEGEYGYENEDGYYHDRVFGEDRNSEDEEDRTDEDRSSSSSGEHEDIIKQEDDKTIVPVTDGPHPLGITVMKLDVKQETKEEVFDGLVIGHPADPKLEKEEILAGTVPDAAIVELAATGSGADEQASGSSRIGPDTQTEGKRVSVFRSLWNPRACISHDPPQILRSHRSKPY
jgi:hypothetical protein